MRNPRIRIALLLVTALALTLGVATAIAAQGDSVKIFVMDRCEPDSFNAAIGAGTCVLNGGVKFDLFASMLNPKDGGHNAWTNSRHEVALKSGEHLTLTNTGGEDHTFTEVANFGTGFVPPLNAALPVGTPPAVPVGPLNFMGAGDTLELGQLSLGTHRFECLIHPWMRTVAEQS